MSGPDINLLQVYEQIQSDKATNRDKGLRDLSLVLKNPSIVENVQDRGWHKMFEALFRAATQEKSSIPRTQGKAREKVVGRLETCADDLKLGVEKCGPYLRYKSVKAIASHIIHILPVLDGSEYSNIKESYANALNHLFAQASHREHLLKEDWIEVVVFCCEYLTAQLTEGKEQALKTSTSGATSQNKNRFFSSILLCLKDLASTPQAYLADGDHMVVLIDTALAVLNTGYVEITYHTCFSILNSTLEAVGANNLEYASKIVKGTSSTLVKAWPKANLPGLRNEFIQHVILGLPHIFALLKSPSEGSLREDLKDLLHEMKKEYGSTGRYRENPLSGSNLVFESLVPTCTMRYNPLRTSTFAQQPFEPWVLQNDVSRDEQAWIIPQLIASIVYTLDHEFEDPQAMDIDNINGVTVKRQKIESHIDEVLRTIRSRAPIGNRDSYDLSKVLSLQVLCFYLDKWMPEFAKLEEVLGELQLLCSDEITEYASWAMLVMTALYKNPKSESFMKSLNNLGIWQVTLRNVTSPSMCGAACNLLQTILAENIVPYSDVRESVDDLISKIEVQGPATLGSSTISFWHQISRSRRADASISPVHLEVRLLQWFLMKWKFGNSTDVTTFNKPLDHASVPELTSILSLCCGQDYFPYLPYNESIFGEIGQALQRSVASLKPVSFLLLGNTPAEMYSETKESPVLERWPKPDPSKRTTEAESQMLEHINQQLDASSEAWQLLTSKKEFTAAVSVPSIQKNGIKTITALLAILSIFGTFLNQPQSKAAELFLTKLSKLISSFKDFFARPKVQSDHIQALVTTVRQFLPKISCYVNDAEGNQLEPPKDNAFSQYLVVLDGIISTNLPITKLGCAQDEDNDMMDIDDEMFGNRDTEIEIPRELFEVMGSVEMTEMRVHEALRFHALAANAKEADEPYRLFSTFLEGLSVPQLILSRPVIKEFLSSSPSLTRDELADLVTSVVKKLLSTYEYERCEVASMAGVEVLKNLIRFWVPQNVEDDLCSRCESLYDWLIKLALDKSASSYKVRMALAELLKDMLSVNMAYGRKGSKSLRTNFLRLLQDEDIRVRYLMADFLPTLFSLYSIEVHARVYEDVRKYLEVDANNLEGLAMRVHSLSRLITASFHVMKNAVFHIFETAWKVPHSKAHAASSIIAVANTLKHNDPKEVFRLFSSHLIHQFLQEDVPMDPEFPYSIFGYMSLNELYSDAEEELVAQLLMFSRDEEANGVSEALDATYEQSIRKSFHKIIAYSTAWGASSAKDETRKPGRSTADSRVRKRLGDAVYVELLSERLALILSTFFEIYTEDDDSERSTQSQEDSAKEHYLARNAALQPAWEAMKTMTTINHSKTRLGQVTKPAFKPRVIITSVDFICGKVNLGTIGTMWDAPLYTFVVRRQLEMIQDALGSMQSCVIIRTIRFVISLAGRVAIEGYPLEMTIHGLIPYLVDPVCNRDTVGVLQYLFTAGRDHLIKIPNFVLSSALKIIASMNTFLATDESIPAKRAQMVDCRDGAVAFREWFTDYLQKYKSSTINDAQQVTFQAITNAIVDGESTTADQALLRGLLRDETGNAEKLLSEATKRTGYAILGNNFRRSFIVAQGWVQNDKEALNLAKILFRICRKFPTGDEFLLWSGRIFGRAFAGSGTILEEWTQESRVKELLAKDSQLQNLPEGTASKSSILRIIESYLSSLVKEEVGVAESTIRTIIFRDTSLRDEKDSIIEKYISSHVITAMRWMTMQPPLNSLSTEWAKLPMSLRVSNTTELPSFTIWAKQVATWLSSNIRHDSISSNVRPLISNVDGFAEKSLPYLLHILLLEQFLSQAEQIKTQISEFFAECFSNATASTIPYVSILIEGVLYLRTQRVPGEATPCERDDWLTLDYRELARAAATCNLFKVALMFVELHVSQTSNAFEDADLLLQIYENTGEPDSYYGVQKQQTLKSIMHKFAFENDGWKSLSFQGARLENHMRQLPLGYQAFDAEGAIGTINALSAIGLNALSYSTLQSQGDAAGQYTDNMYQTAWKLEQWDLPCPPSRKSDASGLYRALQTINLKSDMESVSNCLNEPYMTCLKQVLSPEKTSLGLSANMRTLGMLWEMEEVLSAQDAPSVRKAYETLYRRDKWMETGNFRDVDHLYSARIATCSSMVKRPHLRAHARIEIQNARLFEAKTLVKMCQISRSHNIRQKSLSTSVSLSDMVEPCRNVGIEVEGAAKLEAASVLWDQGETLSAIGMLQPLLNASEKNPAILKQQTIPIGRPELLATTATWIAEARLKKPEVVLEEYFVRAVVELEKSDVTPSDGKVYHQFAKFCDLQLQDQGMLEDLRRIEKLMKQKEEEYVEYERLVKGSSGSKADGLRSFRQKARTLYNIDKAEHDRLAKSRQAFLEKSLDNYLKCLITCDDYDADAIRFCSLWLEHSGNDGANAATENASLAKVASRKFIPMMNQLSSRLQNDQDKFQTLLFALIFRICKDHPFHGLYQILALSRQTVNNKDPTASARKSLAEQMIVMLKADSYAGVVTANLEKATKYFMGLATTRVEKKQTQNLFKKILPSAWKVFDQDMPKTRIPPPTMRIEVRADCDYRKVPYMRTFEPEVILASGISMPKILSCRASNGARYKLLVKGGNDDLRQDAIMEQVFEQVSDLLGKNRITRQRNLGIRTYKVVPLSTTSGIIEFVLHTRPLHDYLLPAHMQYRPQDWKSQDCRREIAKVQDKTRDVRVRVFEKVMEHFQPVMRFFYFHQFTGPDDWFTKRLAYTRSTAAISILGHILGLGDRHGHNILLDERSGEVVHIDLGVAFEQGRVLPVPEVVPFRLTRDIVDGMGITKTEGVFQRCCEFTLSVLRDEAYNIMTILDILRYDPLYSWTISPIRTKKIQEELSVQNEEGMKNKSGETTNAGEADRALTVVMKKLSKTLSVQATVNELITEATDVKNLAVLYGGWAAYV